jgi:predicted nucleotidyltransferase
VIEMINDIKASCGNKVIDMIMDEVVAVSVNGLGNKLDQIWLYGSQARGEADSDSDVDIMVVLKNKADHWETFNSLFNDFSRDILTRYEELLLFIIIDREYFNTSKAELYKNTREEGILYFSHDCIH